MADQPTTRKALYERIRNSSKDEVILEEMIRLGFWPKGDDKPTPLEADLKRRGELSRRINEISRELYGQKSEAALKEEARKARMAEARARRLERKERIVREREERKAAWAERKKREIVYLGEGVSQGLGQRECDRARLEAQGLPVFSEARELAEAMGITVSELRFLAFTRQASRINHYQRFTLPKKSGGVRTISAPMPRLKAVQHWVLESVLAGLKVHEAAHGFVPGRSIVSNARPHLGAEVVVNIDLKDFFPSVSYRRVKGLFRGFGYSEEIATLLGLLCTEPDITAIDLDDETFFVHGETRALPQGAPTSPAITNLLCRRLDARISGVCSKLGFVYTRYADDLSFSAKGAAAKKVGKLLAQVEFVIAEEGFTIHPDKTRIFRRGRRQEVTGLVVNDTLAVPRATLRRFRAFLHSVEAEGPDGKRWGQGADPLYSALGFANFVHMVDADKGSALQVKVRALMAAHGPKTPPPASRGESEREAKEREPGDEQAGRKKKWWKLF